MTCGRYSREPLPQRTGARQSLYLKIDRWRRKGRNMSKEKDVLILAIESSCDETAAAVVKNGREVLSNVISSQIALHTLYGGVVPEIASRKHIEKINQVIQAALDEARVTL